MAWNWTISNNFCNHDQFFTGEAKSFSGFAFQRDKLGGRKGSAQFSGFRVIFTRRPGGDSASFRLSEKHDVIVAWDLRRQHDQSNGKDTQLHLKTPVEDSSTITPN
jgi:hypothetical protein